jgi:hypothetical protein
MEMQTALFWTPGLAQKFQSGRGYDILACLPYLIIKSNYWASSVVPYGETFRSSNNQTFADDCINDYQVSLREGYEKYLQANLDRAHSKDLKYSAQPSYNLPLDMVRSLTIRIPSLLKAPQFHNSPKTDTRNTRPLQVLCWTVQK